MKIVLKSGMIGILGNLEKEGSAIRYVLALLTGMLLFGSAGCATRGPAYSSVHTPSQTIQCGVLHKPELEESSGLARSHCASNRYWTHNDSGDEPRLYAIDKNGNDLGTYLVMGAQAIDWEDMSSAVLADGPVLAAGDIGDNKHQRDDYRIYILHEPADMPAGRSEGLVPVSVRIIYRYPDGEHDCEALGIEPESGDIYLVTKSLMGRCAIYCLPAEKWMHASEEPLVAKRLVRLNISKVTAMDFSEDGHKAIILTYGDAYEYVRNDNESWKQAFSRPARRIVLPERKQGEAVCYDQTGKQLVLTSEQMPAPVWMVQVDEP